VLLAKPSELTDDGKKSSTKYVCMFGLVLHFFCVGAHCANLIVVIVVGVSMLVFLPGTVSFPVVLGLLIVSIPVS